MLQSQGSCRRSFVIVLNLLASTVGGAAKHRNKCSMAWRCSGNTHRELVENLFRNGVFASQRVKDALLSVDRADFSVRDPYADSPQGIGHNATISAPHMHAAALEHLKDHLKEGSYALDVGSGSGYLCACMAHMVGENGRVIGIEHIPELVQEGIRNIEKHHKDLISTMRVKIVEGDGRKGYPIDHKYNAIHVGAAAETIPKELVNQLANGGRMVIPVGRANGGQEYIQLDKSDNGSISQKVVEHVIYVPLTDKSKQLGRFDF